MMTYIDLHTIFVHYGSRFHIYRYRTMTKIFYRDVEGVLLVCDLTNRDHFFALDRWLDEIRNNVHFSSDDHCTVLPHHIPIVLVGNKLDQALDHRVIQPLEGVEFVRHHRLVEYVETSAKTSTNVEKAFTLLLKHILLRRIRAIEEAEAVEQSATKGKRLSRKKLHRESSIKLHNNINNNNDNRHRYHHQSPPPKHRKQKKCSC